MKSTKDSKLEQTVSRVVDTLLQKQGTAYQEYIDGGESSDDLDKYGELYDKYVAETKKQLLKLITSEAEHYANQAVEDFVKSIPKLLADNDVSGVANPIWAMDKISIQDLMLVLESELKKKEKNNTIQRKGE